MPRYKLHFLYFEYCKLKINISKLCPGLVGPSCTTREEEVEEVDDSLPSEEAESSPAVVFVFSDLFFYFIAGECLPSIFAIRRIKKKTQTHYARRVKLLARLSCALEPDSICYVARTGLFKRHTQTLFYRERNGPSTVLLSFRNVLSRFNHRF